MDMLEIIITYKEGLARGLLVTLELSLIIWSSGIALGTFLGFLGARYKYQVGLPLRGISIFLSAIPILVFLFWAHYPMQSILGIVIDPFITAAMVLSIINIVSVADIIRDALIEFPNQYIIAAKVCGLNNKQTFSKIQMPIILRQIMPSLLNLQVTMLQLTLFASLISVEEIFRVAQSINSMIYRPVEIYSALAIFFLAICLPLNILSSWLKNKYTRNLSEK